MLLQFPGSRVVMQGFWRSVGLMSGLGGSFCDSGGSAEDLPSGSEESAYGHQIRQPEFQYNNRTGNQQAHMHRLLRGEEFFS